jgi:Predicted integral membrane protein
MLTIVLKLINAYIWLMVIYAFMSWIPGLYQSALGKFIGKIVDPYLDLFSKLHLQIGGFDFTIWVAVLSLELIERFLVIVFR